MDHNHKSSSRHDGRKDDLKQTHKSDSKPHRELTEVIKPITDKKEKDIVIEKTDSHKTELPKEDQAANKDQWRERRKEGDKEKER